MCGIAVAIDWPDAERLVAQLVEGIKHRGDISDPVLCPRPSTAMGTRRLRIVDRENGIQPQLSADGRIAVSFNGEVYNYRELRRELEQGGIHFKTDSDTEVLANALAVWGPQALRRIVGMYAFVAIDTESNGFLAARDPFGVKPLYLIQGERGLLFCSEMRPLLDAVADGDVLLLPPGFMLTNEVCAPFPSPIVIPEEGSSPGDVRTLDRLLSEAVERRLPSDLPVTTLFSGGIDSTLVAHYVRQFRPDAPGYFIGAKSGPDYAYAAQYADQTGYDLRVVPFDPDSDETFASIDECVRVTESYEPNIVRGAMCSLAVSQQMSRDGFRVSLCGEGADELFCGYPPLEIAFQDDVPMGRAIRGECLGLMHRVSLQRVDRCSMRHQVETREPFLDPAVANYALDLDASALVRDVDGKSRGKDILREIYNLYPDALPASIRDRTKVPFCEGAGLDATPEMSRWKVRLNEEISDRDLFEGRMEFDGFGIQTKEDLFYLRKLAETLPVKRVPHLRGRAFINFPIAKYMDKLKQYSHFSV
jgi:asparagine synthase (glutamine-hydrolysing)